MFMDIGSSAPVESAASSLGTSRRSDTSAAGDVEPIRVAVRAEGGADA